MESYSCSIAGCRAVLHKKKRLEFAPRGERRKRDDAEQAASTLNRRAFLLRGLVGLSFAGLGGQLWRMQIARGHPYQSAAEGSGLRSERLNPPRGRFRARTGLPLGESRRSWTVSILGNRLPEDPA